MAKKKLLSGRAAQDYFRRDVMYIEADIECPNVLTVITNDGEIYNLHIVAFRMEREL